MKLFRLLLALVSFPILAAVAIAQGSYTLASDGYYYQGSQAYTRSTVYAPGYWYGGCYYYGQATYQYTPYYPPAKAAVVTAEDPGWRSKLLDIAGQRDKLNAKLAGAALEQKYYMEAVNALGFQGTGLYAPNYIGSAGYSLTGQITYGAQANTAYGVSYNSLAQIYGQNDTTALFQMSNQHVINAQALAREGQTGFAALVGQEGSNRARVAEIIAKGQIADQVIKSLSAGPEVKGISFQVTSGGKFQKIEAADVDPTVKKDLSDQFTALVAAKCASCHTGKQPKGNFDISTYGALTADQKQVVWARLVTPDDKSVMPQADKGGKITRLTTAELRLFFLN